MTTSSHNRMRTAVLLATVALTSTHVAFADQTAHARSPSLAETVEWITLQLRGRGGYAYSFGNTMVGIAYPIINAQQCSLTIEERTNTSSDKSRVESRTFSVNLAKGLYPVNVREWQLSSSFTRLSDDVEVQVDQMDEDLVRLHISREVSARFQNALSFAIEKCGGKKQAW
jgi:hypothetical protein